MSNVRPADTALRLWLEFINTELPAGGNDALASFDGYVTWLERVGILDEERGELGRVRRCASARCARVFYDYTKNGSRRWCAMGTCGNRAKATRFRAKSRRREDEISR